MAVHTPHAALARRGCKHPACLLGSHLLAHAPAACLGICLHGLPLASTRWSFPAGSGEPGRVTSWRRHWCCRRMRRCAGQGSLCSPFLGAWSSLEERSNACQRWERTHHGDAFWLFTAPAALHALSLVTVSPVPCCVMVPALPRAPVCSMALAGECQTTPATSPTFFSPWRFYLGVM